MGSGTSDVRGWFLSNLAYLTPVVAVVISYVTLGEPIESYAIIEMLFVLGGCLLQIISRKHVGSTKMKQMKMQNDS